MSSWVSNLKVYCQGEITAAAMTLSQVAVQNTDGPPISMVILLLSDAATTAIFIINLMLEINVNASLTCRGRLLEKATEYNAAWPLSPYQMSKTSLTPSTLILMPGHIRPNQIHSTSFL